MNALVAIFKSDILWKGVAYIVCVAAFAGIAQFVRGHDATMQMIEQMKQSVDAYCSAPEFDQYALQRIMDDAIPYRVRIEC